MRGERGSATPSVGSSSPGVVPSRDTFRLCNINENKLAHRLPGEENLVIYLFFRRGWRLWYIHQSILNLVNEA